MGRIFHWTPEKEQALALVHAGNLNADEIAQVLHTSRRTIEGWKRRPDFRARLGQLRASAIAAMMARISGGISTNQTDKPTPRARMRTRACARREKRR